MFVVSDDEGRKNRRTAHWDKYWGVREGMVSKRRRMERKEATCLRWFTTARVRLSDGLVTDAIDMLTKLLFFRPGHKTYIIL